MIAPQSIEFGECFAGQVGADGAQAQLGLVASIIIQRQHGLPLTAALGDDCLIVPGDPVGRPLPHLLGQQGRCPSEVTEYSQRLGEFDPGGMIRHEVEQFLQRWTGSCGVARL
jgi:hypothetical protein